MPISKNLSTLLFVGFILIGTSTSIGSSISVYVIAAYSLYCVLELVRKGKLVITGNMSRFVKYFFLLLIAILVALLINKIFDFSRVLLILCSFVVCIHTYSTINTEEEIQDLLNTIVFFVSISSVFAIAQRMGLPVALSVMARNIGVDDIGILTMFSRYSGLSTNTVTFAYECSAALAILIWLKPKKSMLIWMIEFCVIVLGLFANRTRSALLIFIIIMMVSLIKKRNENKASIVLKMGILLCTFGIVVLFVLETGIIYNFSIATTLLRLDETNSTGTVGRIALFLTAFNHAVHHPFGMGEYQVNHEYIVGFGNNSRILSLVTRTSSHNFLANCVVNYGFIALISLIGMYVVVIKTGIHDIKKMFPQNKYFYVYNAALWAAISNVFNSLFHNRYLLNGDMLLAMFFGIIFCLNRLGTIDNVK